MIVGTTLYAFFMGMGNIFAIASGVAEVVGNAGLLDAAVRGCFSIWSAEFVPAALALRGDSAYHVFAVRTRPAVENNSHPAYPNP